MEIVDKKLLFTVWTTTKCNLRCTYCYEGQEKATLDMTLETTQQVVRFISQTAKEKNCNRVWIVFHGGEPCLNFEVIQNFIGLGKAQLDHLDIRYGLTTNATVLDEKKCEFLCEHLSDITISIDGSEVAHNLNRCFPDGTGSFDIAMKKALFVLSIYPQVRIRMTVTPNNVSFLSSGIKHLVQCGFKTIVPAADYFSAEWDEDGMEQLKGQLLETKEYLASMKDEEVFVAMTDKQELVSLGKCMGGKDSFHISPTGDIYPCVYVVGNEFFKCGSVFNGIDNSVVQMIDEMNSFITSECEGCTCYDACPSSRCKIVNMALTGSPTTPSPVICGIQNVCVHVYHS